ncbi:GGDEF domain-containing protein [Stomatohabitans albus]|uniref:GGDEF domain-containing protein n=1 Tax=Stomatohabitans albus TaxID=3110766 RepID=UPI00300C4056
MNRTAIALAAAIGISAAFLIKTVSTSSNLPMIVFGAVIVLNIIGYVGMVRLKEVTQPGFSSFLSFCAQAALCLGVIALGTDTVSSQVAIPLLLAVATISFSMFIYDLGQLISASPKQGMHLSVWDHVIDSIIAVAVYSTIAWAGFWEPLYLAGYPPVLIGSFVVFVVTLALVVIQRLIALPRFSKSLFDGMLFQVAIIGVLTFIAKDPTGMAIPVLMALMGFSTIVAISCWLPGGVHLLEVEHLARGLQTGRVVTVTVAAAYIPLTLGILGEGNVTRLTLVCVMVTLLLFFRMQAVITIRDHEMQQVNALATELEFQAKHDLTTGLFNLTTIKALLEDKVTQEQHDIALVIIALDGFEHINDIHGYTAGDETLQVLAKRLQSELRPHDIAGRYSGDQFIVLLDHVDRPELGAHLAARLIDVIQEPCRLPGGEEVRLGARAGVSLSTMHDINDLILNAELAVAQIREGGRGAIRLADTSDRQKAMDSISRENLYTLLRDDQLPCTFAPVMDLRTNTPVAMMVRPLWIRPGLPRDLVVYHQLNGPWFKWLFGHAVAWAKQASAPVHVLLNEQQFASLELLPVLDQVLAEHHVSGDLITIGVDSRTRLTHIPIEDFHARGIQICLDSFGATGTNLTDLPHLPLDLLKIDPVLVRDMVTDRGYRVVVEAIIRSSTVMDVPVVCRGIDTERIAAVAQSLGAMYGQGRHWGQPMTAEDALEFWNTHAQPART